MDDSVQWIDLPPAGGGSGPHPAPWCTDAPAVGMYSMSVRRLLRSGMRFEQTSRERLIICRNCKFVFTKSKFSNLVTRISNLDVMLLLSCWRGAGGIGFDKTKYVLCRVIHETLSP